MLSVVVGVGLGGFSPCKDVMPQNAGANRESYVWRDAGREAAVGGGR